MTATLPQLCRLAEAVVDAMAHRLTRLAERAVEQGKPDEAAGIRAAQHSIRGAAALLGHRCPGFAEIVAQAAAEYGIDLAEGGVDPRAAQLAAVEQHATGRDRLAAARFEPARSAGIAPRSTLSDAVA